MLEGGLGAVFVGPEVVGVGVWVKMSTLEGPLPVPGSG